MLLTYNIKLDFKNQEQKDYWLNRLKTVASCYNDVSELVWNNKNIKLGLKEIHSLVYTKMREKYKDLPSQIIIKIYKSVISSYRSCKKKYKCLKKQKSCQLDKRLYSELTSTSIKLKAPNEFKRIKVEFKLYKKFQDLANKYTMRDPNMFIRDNEIYLAIPFDAPSKPAVAETYLGIDLGVRRLVTTSDGNVIDDKKLKASKRKIRKLKRELQAKKTRSAKRLLRKLKHKERNINKYYAHQICNELLKTDKTVLVLEDLKKIKQSTSRTEEGYKKRKHNNRMSQIPFYLIREILSYKAPLLGKRVETVSPYNTSRIDCMTNKIDGERVGCRYYSTSGKIYDADWNAAINIRNRKHFESFRLPVDGGLNFLNRVSVNNPYISESNLAGKLLSL